MAAVPYHVVHSFVAGRHDSAGAFLTTGDTIYSYNMKLAHKDGKGRIVYDYKPLKHGNKAPSVTTARHMKALESVCDPGAKPGAKKNPARPGPKVRICTHGVCKNKVTDGAYHELCKLHRKKFKKNPAERKYEVVVGNVGTVYYGNDAEEASQEYGFYVSLSKQGQGRAGGETVTLLCDNRIVKEHVGQQDYEDNPKVQSTSLFKIVRQYYDGRPPRALPGKGMLTLAEAQAHCRDPSTRKAGVYFDGYEAEWVKGPTKGRRNPGVKTNPKKISGKIERFLDRENVEIFSLSANEAKSNRDELRDLDREKGKRAGWHQENAEHNGLLRAGWYYWQCFPGCLPEGSASGPFKSEYAAATDAFENWGDDFED